MNVSKHEQRVLHALAQGGHIRHRRDPQSKRILGVDCFNRDGFRLDDCTMDLFARLRRRGFIESRGGAPYRISRLGLATVRAQLDNC